jgi:hypothetical protein
VLGIGDCSRQPPEPTGRTHLHSPQFGLNFSRAAWSQFASSRRGHFQLTLRLRACRNGHPAAPGRPDRRLDCHHLRVHAGLSKTVLLVTRHIPPYLSAQRRPGSESPAFPVAGHILAGEKESCGLGKPPYPLPLLRGALSTAAVGDWRIRPRHTDYNLQVRIHRIWSCADESRSQYAGMPLAEGKCSLVTPSRASLAAARWGRSISPSTRACPVAMP